MRFRGKAALVTGGSSGIGASIAVALAAEGAMVAVVASSDVGKARATADAIIAKGGTAAPFAADVRDAAAMERLVAEVEQAFGQLDLVVNAAGIFAPSPVGETDSATLDKMVDINLKGSWNVVNAAVPALKRAGGGRIVNFASVAGIVGVKGFAVYSATKAAVMMMTRALSGELAPMGININAIAPGNTATPMNAAVREDEAALAQFRAMTPSGNPFSDADDLAGIALFLLSDAARPVHGSTWLADEGISAAIG